MFAKAVELDPNYGRAYAGLADCDSFLYLMYRVEVPIDGSSGDDREGAEPGRYASPKLTRSRGLALSAAHRREEAKAEFEKAIALDPNLFEAHYFYARSSFAEGKFAAGRPPFRARLRDQAGRLPICRACLSTSTDRLAGLKRAKRPRAKASSWPSVNCTLHPEDPRPAHLGAGALFELGEMERAREWIARALAIDPDDPLTLYNVACGYTKLGDFELACDLLERAIRTSGPELANWAKHDSDLDGLRSHPRFQKILDQIR